MRRFAFAAAAFCALAAPAAAQTPTGVYPGTVSCAKLAFTKGPLRARATLTVSGGSVTLTRVVYNPDGTLAVGAGDGSGTISPSGDVVVSSAFRRGGTSMTAEFRGRVTGTGGALQGSEIWTREGKTYPPRPCSYVFRR